MSKNFVSINNIAKRWNGQLGVEDISLNFAKGSFVALLGPSGCGKSTTLRLLSGLEQADEGTIEIDGVDVTDKPPSERNLSMVFQSYALFPHLTVQENVIFGLRVRKTPPKERQEKLIRALEITGLVGFENRKPAALSGGQRQRVALARAIVANQPLCLMDEPLSNLDAKLRNSVRKDIKKLQVDLGITVVYVTHDQTEAMSMADTVVLMRDGRIQQTGSPEELYYKPNNIFVAEFIGSPPMAIINGSSLKGFENYSSVGIRAENLHVSPKGKGRLVCEVSECEFLGSETFVGLSHPSAKGLTISMPGVQNIDQGKKLEITFADENLHFFDVNGDRTS